MSALLSKLEEKFGTAQTADSFEPVERSYILVVLGLFYFGGDAQGDAVLMSVDSEMWLGLPFLPVPSLNSTGALSAGV